MQYELTIIDGDALEIVHAPNHATMRDTVCSRLPGLPLLREDWTYYNCDRVACWTSFGARDVNWDASALFLINHHADNANERLLFGPVILVKEL